MPRVKYKGTSNYREILAADWKSVGVEDQGKVVWDRDNARGVVGAKPIQEVSEAAAQYLLDNEPEGDFEVLEDEIPDIPEGGGDADAEGEAKAGKAKPKP